MLGLCVCVRVYVCVNRFIPINREWRAFLPVSTGEHTHSELSNKSCQCTRCGWQSTVDLLMLAVYLFLTITHFSVCSLRESGAGLRLIPSSTTISSKSCLLFLQPATFPVSVKTAFSRPRKGPMRSARELQWPDTMQQFLADGGLRCARCPFCVTITL